MKPDDTIFALASGAGRSGIAVIRLSGPAAGQALEALSNSPLPKPRQATRATFYGSRAHKDEILDDGLVLWFPAPASFTGEDVVELHIHGGPAVIDALLTALVALPGLRPAEAGEYSRRSFENGKFDLTAAEGLADLIEAETEAQRRQARRQSRGELGRVYDAWRERLIRAQALMEADIDFSDEDIPDDLIGDALAIAGDLEREISGHLDDGHRGERLRAGLYLAIIGPPNAGKSSLLNRLARRDAAIVSEIAGTTRDVIDVHLDLGGYPVIAADTAGLREAVQDSIESEGVRRARQRADDADMKLAVFDATDLKSDTGLDPLTLGLIDADTFVILNKCELVKTSLPKEINKRPAFPVSAKTGAGFDDLLANLQKAAAERLAGGAGPAITRLRHRNALTSCCESLSRAANTTEPELMGEDLRLAARALGTITGRVDVEDLLDVIFSEFCIGK
ncbi:MAG: tRNA uridine-5-carboxymethylaminomethyl(34) synthesis GTPase MnmE [Rhodospirillales bacterium]|nr:tRNA uridine-5-carboxymethylaminomethyl(34) synthesis GTPase MnmE [Rhodospirillales bacterium]